MSLDNLMTALAHTLIGMGTVFIILILISAIIYLFKFIPKPQEWAAKRKQKNVPEPVAAPEPVQPVEIIEDETDDLELVAVISAAIAAAMGKENTDGFVVRSIRRSKGNRW